MADSFPTGGFGFGGSTDGMWQAIEQLRAAFEKKVGGTRMGRGDVRAAVLALLAEKPMHGYQIIREIEERSGGSWKPSAGSVYPTLQLLADEGLITAEESNGRKTYALTEAGRAEAAASEGTRRAVGRPTGAGRSGRRASSALCRRRASSSRRPPPRWGAPALPSRCKQAAAVLDEARRRLYSILAQD